MEPQQVVGQRLAEIREGRGMSQADLGQELGKLLKRPWPRQTVSAAEKGERAFTATEIVALAWILETPVDQFLVAPSDVRAIVMPSGTTIDAESLRQAIRPAVESEWNDVLSAADRLSAAGSEASVTAQRAARMARELRQELYAVAPERQGEGAAPDGDDA